MSKQTPLVSVSMISFHAEAFISEAIEGVLSQKTDFGVELVIGDDCSRDNTRAICEEYAQKHPGIVRVLPMDANMGIAANTLRTMSNCRGKYIAVCDGDDTWTDPLKLKRQVDFLEKNPEFGVVYSDVTTVDENGRPVDDPEQDQIRALYTEGEVFFKLLQANFINNSTAVFRRELIADHIVYPDRAYQIPDHIRWLHIATRARVHFMNSRTTNYRKHSSGLSVAVPREKIRGNRHFLYRSLFNIIPAFDKHNKRALTPDERLLLFRRMCSLILRGPGSIGNRLRILILLPKYFPGIPGLLKLCGQKIRKALSFSIIKSYQATSLSESKA